MTNWRSIKKYESKMYPPVMQAYYEGQAVAHYGNKTMPPRLQKNPYPAGYRHNEYERGLKSE